VFTFFGEIVEVRNQPGRLVIAGEYASEFAAEVIRLTECQQRAQVFRLAVFDRMPFEDFLSLPDL